MCIKKKASVLLAKCNIKLVCFMLHYFSLFIYYHLIFEGIRKLNL